MENLTTENLFELAQRKLQLLDQLQFLSADQASLVTDQRIDDLLSLLARKSEIIDSLNDIQKDFQPFAAQDAESRIWSTPKRREDCRELFRLIEVRIQQLLIVDEYSLKEMNQQREITLGQIEQIATADTIAHAYQNNLPDDSFELAASLNLEG